MTTVEEHIDKLEEATKVLEARLASASANLARQVAALESRNRKTQTGN